MRGNAPSRLAAEVLAVACGLLQGGCQPTADLERSIPARLTRWISFQPCASLEPPIGGLKPHCGFTPTSAQRERLLSLARERDSGRSLAAAVALSTSIEDLLAARKRLASETAGWTSAERNLAAGALEHAIAMSSGDAAYLVDAFEHTEAALAEDPSSLAALFNRALIASDLGLCRFAAKTWRQYLARDPSSDWAAEATARLSRLPCEVEIQDSNSSPDALISYAIGTLVPSWLKAREQGVRAEHFLEQIALMGEELLARTGDPTIRDLAEVIKAADEEHLFVVLSACIRGRVLLEDGHYDQARRELLWSGETLRARRSPLAPWNEVWIVRVDLAEGRFQSAEDRFAILARDLRGRRPRYLNGAVQWYWGLAAARAGTLPLAYDHIARAEEEFRRGGYRITAASMRALQAETLTHLGFGREAWTPRILSLRALQALPSRFRYLRSGLLAADAAAQRSEAPRLADAFLVEATEIAANVISQAKSLLAKGRSFRERGANAPASASYRRALDSLRAIKLDPARERLRRVALLGLWSDPSYTGTQEKAFVATLDFFGANGPLYLRLEALRLEAARERRAGDVAAARRTLDDAVELAKRLNTDIESDEFGIRHLEALQDLFDDAIDAALAADERLRALELLEAARRGVESGTNGATSVAGLDPAIGSAVDVRAGEPIILVFGITPRNFAWWRLDGGRVRSGGGETRRVEALVGGLDSVSQKAKVDALADLYQVLLANALEGVPRDRQLVIVPDGILQRVPFAALREPETGVPLIARRALSFRTSLAAARQQNMKRPLGPRRREWDVTAVGDPAFDQRQLPLARLPAAGGEARRVAAMYGGGSRLLEGSAATVRAVRQALASAEVLHVAAHATAGRGPSDGALVLAADSEAQSSGLASASDIVPAEHGLQLAVLSGCSTLGVEPSRSGGLLGLARAFATRGVPATLGTLWKLDDQLLAELMTDFHRFLLDGHSAAEALRRAQLAYLADPARPCCDWAALQLIGDLPPEPPLQPSR